MADSTQGQIVADSRAKLLKLSAGVRQDINTKKIII
jgi:hypothetical protein